MVHDTFQWLMDPWKVQTFHTEYETTQWDKREQGHSTFIDRKI